MELKLLCNGPGVKRTSDQQSNSQGFKSRGTQKEVIPNGCFQQRLKAKQLCQPICRQWATVTQASLFASLHGVALLTAACIKTWGLELMPSHSSALADQEMMAAEQPPQVKHGLQIPEADNRDSPGASLSESKSES